MLTRGFCVLAGVLTRQAHAVPGLTLTKYGTGPVIGPSYINGAQDYCGARDMGLAQAGGQLNLVYSGYSTCAMDQEVCAEG